MGLPLLYFSSFTETSSTIMKLVWKRSNAIIKKKRTNVNETIALSNWKELNQMISDHFEKEKLSNLLKQCPDEKKRIF